MSARPCREESCGQMVIFAKDKATGKWQVLSNQAPMWRQVGVDDDGVPVVERVHDTLLSHFVNCSNPARFSAGHRETRDFSEPKSAND